MPTGKDDKGFPTIMLAFSMVLQSGGDWPGAHPGTLSRTRDLRKRAEARQERGWADARAAPMPPVARDNRPGGKRRR